MEEPHLRKNMRQAGVGLLAAAVLAGSAQAATITSSTEQITLDADQETFTLVVSMEESDPFAGAEFGIDLPDGVELTEVEFLSDLGSVSHVETQRESRYYFGFYDTENRFSGSYDVAELTFTYTGDADVEIVLGYSQVVTLLADGTTEGDETSSGFTVAVTREDDQGGGSGGSSGGGSSGGGSSSSGNTGGETDIGDEETPLGGAPFTDVPEDAWYKEAVDYVYANGLMSGTSATTFAPSTQLSRAMMVQILYNLEDRPAAAESAAFTDVAADAWYAGAVNWAAGEGIVSGYGNGKFGPDDLITREQMANMLYYYAQWAGLEPSAGADALQGFQDAGQVSSWASDAVSWAVSSGLISGTGNQTLAPTATATRAEVAQIMMAFRKGQA